MTATETIHVTAPALPPGYLVAVPGRGEVFVRTLDEAQSGPPVVLLHGWMANADLNWFSVFEPLGATHRVIAPDLPGHGRSSLHPRPMALEAVADDIAALLRRLDAVPAVVVGYSLGSSVAQLVAHRHPEVVVGLVLGGGELMPAERVREKVELRLGGWLGSVQRLSEGRWLAQRLANKAVRETPDVERLRPWLVGELERGHPGSIRAAGRAMGRFDGRAAAAGRRCPASVILTTRDHIVPADRQRRLARAWDATVFEIDADHDAPVAQCGPFADAVVAAVADVVRRSSVPGGEA
ncbi:MAG: alpha/beta hydrolase [Actinobacteria bacterium]|nr:alpha/beta hydrolase [Actinomycetota bacterium]